MIYECFKYTWSAFLTQEHTISIDSKRVSNQYLITFVSVLFQGSQTNWAALTKEVCAIYTSIKKLSFYLGDVSITIVIICL